MKIVVVLDIDEEKLAETGHSFDEEMGWAEQSGIVLKKSIRKLVNAACMNMQLLHGILVKKSMYK